MDSSSSAVDDGSLNPNQPVLSTAKFFPGFSLYSFKKLVFILLAALAVVFSSCMHGNKFTANVSDRSFKDEIQVTDNLTFTFDKDIVKDSLLNVWDTVQYVKFDPPVKGRFMWSEANVLVFSPSAPFPPATDYKAELTDKVVKSTLYKLGKDRKFKFHTPYLQMIGVNFFWALPADNPGQPQLECNLQFNFPVDIKQISQNLVIELDGEKKNFKLVSEQNSAVVDLVIPDQTTEDKEVKYLVIVAEGMIPLGGNEKTKEDIKTDGTIPSPFKLTINDLKTDHDGVDGFVTLSTSQQVSEDNIKDHIKIEPAIKSFDVKIDRESFTIVSSDFDMDNQYKITVTQGLKGQIGGELKEDYTNDFMFGELEPSIAFADGSGTYLSGKGFRNIAVNISNVEKVKVKITKIYENNIVHTLQNGYNEYDYGYEDEYDGDYYGDGNSDNASDQDGDVIYEQEIDTKTLQRKGSMRLLHLDFDDKIKDYKGLYEITVSSDKDYWLKDNRFISITDIGLIAKEGKGKIYVFANSLKDAKPLSGVKCTFIAANNQDLGNATTDGDGVAVFELKHPDLSGFRTALITANLGDDYTYMPYNRTEVNNSQSDIGGKRDNPAGMDAFIYGDRELYRPGETAYITSIIRTSKWQAPGEIPVKMKIVAPSGKEMKTVKKTLNEQGSFETSIDFPSNALTGTYSIDVYTSNDVLLNSSSIKVEEFVPDRIKVTADFDKKELRTGESATLAINAMNLFGTPAANRNYEVQMDMSRSYFYPKDYPDYEFDIQKTENSFESVTRQGTTDDDGNASEEFSIDSAYNNMGKLKSDYYVTVFDETGRPVHQFQSLDIYTQDIFYGIGYGDYYVPLEKAITFPLIACDTKGKAQSNVMADVQIIKHEYKTVLSKSGDYFRYESQEEDVVVEHKQVTLNGKNTSYSFVPKVSGQYEIRMTKPGVNTYVSRNFYSYGYMRTYNSSFEVSREGEIKMKFDKDVYNPGDKAKVLLTAPFDGRILVTVEQNDVLKDFYVDTKDKAAEVTIDVTDAFVPNVYVAATLIRPHDESEMPLTVANGFYPLNVENKDNKLDVKITAVDKSRSNTKQTITVKTAPNAYVTVAAVDEGILQVTNYKTPDPYGFFYQKRALEVRSFNVYPYLFPELSGDKAIGGGDDEMNLNKRTNPMNNKRFKLVSFWSGIIKANSSGTVTFDVNVPQFSGDLRIMAVAYKGKQFGSSEAHMKVADPIVVSPSIPRFVSPGDTLVMPVTMDNTTSKDADVTASVSTEGLLKVVGNSSQKTKIKANGESVVTFALIAQQDIGEAKITVTADGMGEKFVNATDITVRPSSGLQKNSGSGSVAGGKSSTVTMDVAKFIPSSVDNKLIVSTNPMLEFADHLEYLVNYPYGCAEQTISTAFPQIYYDDLSKMLGQNTGGNQSANSAYNVQQAIRKIQLQQLYNGGITYWPDNGDVNWWVTCYAGHFLLEAKKAGFDVDDGLLNGIFDYLNMRLKNKETMDYWYNRTQNKKIAPKEVAYSLYVLALADKASTSTMNYYKSNLDLLSLDSKYLLAAAFYLSGDRTKYQEILPSQFAGEESVATFGGSFYSYLRDEAIALDALLDIDPNNQQVGIMAKHISEQLKGSVYLNTQERVFSFLALGKIARMNKDATVTATIKSNGKTVGNFKGETLTLKTKDLQGTTIDIATTGSGNLYYFWEAEGISRDGSYKEEDNYMRVRKAFYNRFGQPLAGNTFNQNDLVVVKLSIQGATNTYIENVVISDIIPAGFEIENPRLDDNIPGTEWVKDASYPDYQDIRDDRINLFVNVDQNQKNYYYIVRAVSLGTYQMGPVGADAMYKGEYHSYWGARKIRVIK